MTSDSAKPRAVSDTNLLVSAIVNAQGAPRQLLHAVEHGDFTPLLSPPLFREYRRVLPSRAFADRFGIAPSWAEAVIALVEDRAEWVTPTAVVPVVVRDPKDEMVLATALGDHADFLVTGDDDLLALRDESLIAPLRIVTVREFLDVLAVGR